jgi:4-amino-4-deoxy-L-arabinose transferase-like glycosyltransferase
MTTTRADVAAPTVQAAGSDAPLDARQWRLAVVGELVLGGVLGTLFLGTHSLFLDESVSASLATAPWHRFANVVSHREANMALYYLLLRGWVVFGHSEIALRSLSVLLAVGSLWVVIMLSRELFGKRTALAVGLLLAVNPLYVQFAQDVRGYALALLLVSASCYLFVRGMGYRSPAPRWCWTAYTVVTALAAYTNFWAALVPLAQTLSLAFLPPDRIPWRRLLAAAAALAVLLIPLGLLIQSTDSAGVNWAAGSSAGHLFTRIRSTVPHAALDAVVLVASVVVVVAIVLLRRRRAIGDIFARQWAVVFTACWLVVPVAAVVMLSLVDRPLFVVRYLMVSLPPALMLVAVGIVRVSALARRRATQVALTLVTVVVVASLVGVAQWYQQGGPQDFRSAVSYVAGRAHAGDGMLIYAPYERIPVEWYLADRPGVRVKLHPVYPAKAWGVDPLYFDGNVALTASDVERTASDYGRIWLLSATADQKLYPGGWASLEGALRRSGFSAAGTRTFRGVEVTEEVRQ